MTSAASPPTAAPDALQALVQRVWGFTALRPLQDQAMRAVLDGQDSLLVLPTGGGKSLCYQAPAVLRGDTTVVVSPLIALMKDQVDALRALGVPAAALNSSLGPGEARLIEQAVRDGDVRLLFVSPERLATEGLRRLLADVGVRRFAIDEAHCISHWGHDFRPEYRQLRELKQRFPQASVHAFTATATQRVRVDIIEQLALADPRVLVGDFDRPNLTYRVIPRITVLAQARDLLARHPGEAGIVYCIRRKDVDELTADLQSAGVQALAYHAGLTADQRKRVQNLFKQEACNLVVATVAFGMGIDRSNIRFVLHTGMPKSIEHYQQETGRAGRDGLEAECVLLYSAADVMTWKRLIEKSADDAEQPVDPQYVKSALRHLADMEAYCRPLVCRHRFLVEYFGQPYAGNGCQACDVCLGDATVTPVADAQTIARKILSCVARVQERFGIGHVVSVLRGEGAETVTSRGHDQLSTYGLLAEHSKHEVRDWVHQLLVQQVLEQTADDYPVLKLNAASWEVMHNRRQVKLHRPQGSGKAVRASRAEAASWEAVDRDLFEALRELRRRLAEEREVPPYIIFSDNTLRELARVRPTTPDRLRQVHGIGERKLAEFGAAVIQLVQEHCTQHQVASDVPARSAMGRSAPPKPTKARSTRGHKQAAFELFRTGTSVGDVARRTGRPRTTVVRYLCDFITQEQPASVEPWVPGAVYRSVCAAAERVRTGGLAPVYEALAGQVPEEAIQIVLTHRALQGH